MLEVFQLQQVRPGRPIEYVNRLVPTDSRRLVVELYPQVPYYRISYRKDTSSHNHSSGKRSTEVTWRQYFVFNEGHVYTIEDIALPNFTPPPALKSSQVRILQSAVRGNTSSLRTSDFRVLNAQGIKALWSDLKLWTRL